MTKRQVAEHALITQREGQPLFISIMSVEDFGWLFDETAYKSAEDDLNYPIMSHSGPLFQAQ